MNGMNKNTRRVDDIIRAFNEFDEEAVNNYYSVGENGDYSEAENYEVDLMDNELFSDDTPKSYSNDLGLEGADYYSSKENYGFENRCNDEATYRTDNEDNYYTEFMGLVGNDSIEYCNESLNFKENNSVEYCDESFSDGVEEGYSEGYEEGIVEGKNSKCKIAYDRGYCNGFQDGYEKAKQEVIDYVNARRKEKNCCKKKCCCKRRCCCKRNSCC